MVMKYLDHLAVPYRVEEAEGDTYTSLANTYGLTVPLVYNDENKKGMVGYSIPGIRRLLDL